MVTKSPPPSCVNSSVQAYTAFIKAVYSNISKGIFSFFQSLFFRNKTGYIWHILSLLFVINCIGCDDPTSDGDYSAIKNDPLLQYTCDNLASSLPINNSKSEYPTYYFTKGETRPIMVYSRYSGPTNIITLSGAGLKSSKSVETEEGRNQYLIANTDGSYSSVVSLEVTAVENTGEFTPTLSNCNFNEYPKIVIGEKREYYIDYNCMTGSDAVTEYEDTLKKFIKRVYEDSAGTDVVLSVSSGHLNLPQEIIEYEDDDEMDEAIWNWLDGKGIIFLNNWTHLTGIYSMAQSQYLLGKTVFVPQRYNPTGNNKKYTVPCFFYTNISNKVIEMGLIHPYWRRRLFVVSILHELGHGRGRDFTSEDGYPLEYPLTNADHTQGHDGVGNDYCLLGKVENKNVHAMLDNCTFCSGHKQMLFNAKFKPNYK